GDLDALVAQPGDAPGPFSLDHGSPFELQAKLGEKSNDLIERLDHDAHVIHPLEVRLCWVHPAAPALTKRLLILIVQLFWLCVNRPVQVVGMQRMCRCASYGSPTNSGGWCCIRTCRRGSGWWWLR